MAAKAIICADNCARSGYNMYKILRFFSDGRPAKRIKVVSSLELAQLHCNSSLTKGVLRSGVKWFDGFKEIKR